MTTNPLKTLVEAITHSEAKEREAQAAVTAAQAALAQAQLAATEITAEHRTEANLLTARLDEAGDHPEDVALRAAHLRQRTIVQALADDVSVAEAGVRNRQRELDQALRVLAEATKRLSWDRDAKRKADHVIALAEWRSLLRDTIANLEAADQAIQSSATGMEKSPSQYGSWADLQRGLRDLAWRYEVS